MVLLCWHIKFSWSCADSQLHFNQWNKLHTLSGSTETTQGLRKWSLLFSWARPVRCDLFFVNVGISLANFVRLGCLSSAIGELCPAGPSYCTTIGQISNELVWLCNEDKNGQMYESNRFDPLQRQAQVVSDCLSERVQTPEFSSLQISNIFLSEPGGGSRPQVWQWGEGGKVRFIKENYRLHHIKWDLVWLPAVNSTAKFE